MLAGHPPFHSNPKYRYQITRLTYSPMKGPAWDHISPEAKDLVDNMLKKNPEERYNLTQVLNHPWLKSSAPDTVMGDEYTRRIKSIALKNKLKRFFLAHNITAEHQNLKESFQQALPFLRPISQTPFQSTNKEFIQQQQENSNEFHRRLLGLKEYLVSAIFNSPETEIISEPTTKKRRLVHTGVIDYVTFCTIVNENGLDVLASPEIFSIFDTDQSGTIDMKEFLITLLALRPSTSNEDDLEAAKLYFSVFDIDEDGYIGVNELELVIGCLLHDGAGPLLLTSDSDVNSYNVTEMFNCIDLNNDGRIDFNEFKDFYTAVLLPSTIQSSSNLLRSLSGFELGYSHSNVIEMLNADDV